MKVIGIDTATMMGSVGIIDDDRPLGQLSINIERTHSERLMAAVSGLIESVEITLDQINCLAISIGPGSFTGLRIGLGTVKGLSMVSGKSIVPVSTLEALAYNTPFCRYIICPILDAKKSEVYTAFFKYADNGSIIRLTDDLVISPGLLINSLNEPVMFTGDGVYIYRDLLRRHLGDLAYFAPANTILPSGISIAMMGLQNFKKGMVGSSSLVPVYIRKSEAEIRFESRSVKLEVKR
ncbi:MAG TPA: tRNA (adenosine(37)-N6)-threonylcarbamoyltransferase complex dimerization subunit type 1 TsaB [Nitrospirota bacterium]|nr:tRNA (adenosine(37)-N6)-threonylcarbamoyltransferase complex dimerization subunit type 1 TsaB [Nitrospirota bacterium]